MALKPENLDKVRAFVANEDLSTAGRLLVKPVDASGEMQVAKVTTAGEFTLGVVVTRAAAGKPADVCDDGRLFVEAEDDTYTPGDKLSASANAKVKKAAPGEHVMAIAIEGATTSAGRLHVRLAPPVIGIVPGAALTAADASVIDTAYDATEQGVLENLRTRVGELEDRLRAAGIIA